MSEEGRAPSIQYLGHSTVLVDIGGVRLLTDPLLRRRVAHLRRAGRVDATALHGVNAVLISHLHLDHLDFGSLARLDPEITAVVPRGAGQLVRRKDRHRDIVEIAAGEEIELGALRIRATPAEHDARRSRFRTRAEPVGYRIDGERSVYFAGDTDVFPEMAQIGPVDVALVPIWGWGPSIGPGHMDPAGAAASLRLLRPKVAIPIHWGTYHPLFPGTARRPAWLDTPAETFRAEAATSAPDVDVRILRPGERTAI